MPTVKGSGIIPSARPVSVPVVRGLFNEASPASAEYAKADRFAPEVEMGAFGGEYVTDETWNAIDLSQTPSALTPAAMASTDYEGLEIQLGSRSFEVGRYKLGKIDLPDYDVQRLRLENGIEMERFAANKLRARYDHTRYVLGAGALDTTSNYNGGTGTGSPVTLGSSTANDLIGEMENVKDYFRDYQRDPEGEGMLIVVSGNLRGDLKRQDQVRDAISAGAVSPDFSLKGYATDAALSRWFAEYWPGSEVLFLDGRMKNAAGTVVRPFGDPSATNGAIAFIRAAGGVQGRSFLKTAIASAESRVNITRETVEAMPGQRLFGNALLEMHLADPLSGYLWTGCAA